MPSVVLAQAGARAPADTSATASLVQAELAFARRVADSDVRTGFLEVLSTDAVVFRPGVVDAREWYETHESPPIELSWSPAAARASAAGDLGFTTGPYRVRSAGGGRAVGQGYYLSVWRREQGRGWKLLTDIGVETDAPDEPLPVAPAGGRGTAFRDPGAARAALVDANDRWSRRGSRPGDAADLATPDIRVLRTTRPLARGVAAAAAAMQETTREPGGTGLVALAASLDFGFTRGMRLEAARGGSRRVHYVRVWVTDAKGGWRVLADVESPEPASGS